VRDEIRAMRQNGVLLREIAKYYADGEYRIPLGTLSRIDHDPNYAPHKPVILKALGLPALAPAPVCPACGVIHLRRCPRRPAPPEWVDKAADWLAQRQKEYHHG